MFEVEQISVSLSLDDLDFRRSLESLISHTTKSLQSIDRFTFLSNQALAHRNVLTDSGLQGQNKSLAATKAYNQEIIKANSLLKEQVALSNAIKKKRVDTTNSQVIYKNIPETTRIRQVKSPNLQKVDLLKQAQGEQFYKLDRVLLQKELVSREKLLLIQTKALEKAQEREEKNKQRELKLIEKNRALEAKFIEKIAQEKEKILLLKAKQASRLKTTSSRATKTIKKTTTVNNKFDSAKEALQVAKEQLNALRAIPLGFNRLSAAMLLLDPSRLGAVLKTKIFSGLVNQTKQAATDLIGFDEKIFYKLLKQIAPSASQVKQDLAGTKEKLLAYSGLDKATKEFLNSLAVGLADASMGASSLEDLLSKVFTSGQNSFSKLAKDSQEAFIRLSKFNLVLKNIGLSSDQYLATLLQSRSGTSIFKGLSKTLDRPLGERKDAIQTQRLENILQRASEIIAAPQTKTTTILPTDSDKDVLKKAKTKAFKYSNVFAEVADDLEELILVMGGYADTPNSGTFRAREIVEALAKNDSLRGKQAIGLLNTDTYKGNLNRELAVQLSILRPNLRGFSRDAEEMAAQAVAALEKNKKLILKLVGESGGGFVVEEATQILNKLGYGDRVKSFAYGTPDFKAKASKSPNHTSYLGINQQETLGHETNVLYSRLGLVEPRSMGARASRAQSMKGLEGHMIDHYYPLEEFQKNIIGSDKGKKQVTSKPKYVLALKNRILDLINQGLVDQIQANLNFFEDNVRIVGNSVAPFEELKKDVNEFFKDYNAGITDDLNKYTKHLATVLADVDNQALSGNVNFFAAIKKDLPWFQVYLKQLDLKVSKFTKQQLDQLKQQIANLDTEYSDYTSPELLKGKAVVKRTDTVINTLPDLAPTDAIDLSASLDKELSAYLKEFRTLADSPEKRQIQQQLEKQLKIIKASQKLALLSLDFDFKDLIANPSGYIKKIKDASLAKSQDTLRRSVLNFSSSIKDSINDSAIQLIESAQRQLNTLLAGAKDTLGLTGVEALFLPSVKQPLLGASGGLVKSQTNLPTLADRVSHTSTLVLARASVDTVSLLKVAVGQLVRLEDVVMTALPMLKPVKSAMQLSAPVAIGYGLSHLSPETTAITQALTSNLSHVLEPLIQVARGGAAQGFGALSSSLPSVGGLPAHLVQQLLNNSAGTAQLASGAAFLTAYGGMGNLAKGLGKKGVDKVGQMTFNALPDNIQQSLTSDDFKAYDSLIQHRQQEIKKLASGLNSQIAALKATPTTDPTKLLSGYEELSIQIKGVEQALAVSGFAHSKKLQDRLKELKGIQKALQKAIKPAIDQVTSITSTISTQVEKLYSVEVTPFGVDDATPKTLKDAIKAYKAEIISYRKQIEKKILNSTITDEELQAGRSLSERGLALSQVLRQQKGFSKEAREVGNVSKTLAGKVDQVQPKEQGAQIAQDVVNGLLMKQDQLLAQVLMQGHAIGANLIQGFKDELGIRSPSKKFEEEMSEVGAGAHLGAQKQLKTFKQIGIELADQLSKGFSTGDFRSIDIGNVLGDFKESLAEQVQKTDSIQSIFGHVTEIIRLYAQMLKQNISQAIISSFADVVKQQQKEAQKLPQANSFWKKTLTSLIPKDFKLANLKAFDLSPIENKLKQESKKITQSLKGWKQDLLDVFTFEITPAKQKPNPFLQSIKNILPKRSQLSTEPPSPEPNTKNEKVTPISTQIKSEISALIAELEALELPPALKESLKQLKPVIDAIGNRFNWLASRVLLVTGAFFVIKSTFNAIRQSISSGMMQLSQAFDLQTIINQAIDLQVLENRFKAIGQSMTTAKEIANELGVSMKSIGAVATISSALSTSYTPEKSLEISKSLTEGLTKRGVVGEPLDKAQTAFEQIASKGIVSLEELRQQLGDSLPNATRIAAEAMGMTTDAFVKLVSSGQLLASDFLPLMATELNKSGSGLSEITKEFVKAGNTFTVLQSSFGQGALNALNPVFKAFNALGENSKNLQTILTLLSVSMTALGVSAVASSAQILGQAIAATKLGKAFALVGTILKGITLQMLAKTSLAAAAAGSILLAVTSITFKSNARTELDSYGKAFEDFNKQLVKTQTEIQKTKSFIEENDWTGRLTNFVSFGGVERREQNLFNIKVSDDFATANENAMSLLRTQEQLNQIVTDTKQKEAEKAGLKIDLQNAQIAGADKKIIEDIQLQINQKTEELANLSKIISDTDSQYEAVKAYIKTEAFQDHATESDKQYWSDLLKFLEKAKIKTTALQKELENSDRFNIKIDIEQAKLEGLKQDTLLLKAKVDTNALEQELALLKESNTASIDVALRIDQNGLTTIKETANILKSEVTNLQSSFDKISSELTNNNNTAITSMLEGRMGGTKLTDASFAQLSQIKQELTATGEQENSVAMRAIQNAIERKNIETELIGKKKELLEKQKEQLLLEQKITAAQRNRSASAVQFKAAKEIGQINRDSINQQIEVAKGQIAGVLTETTATFRKSIIDLNKSQRLMMASNSRFEALKNQLLTSTDAATKDWFLKSIGQPGENLAEVINTIGSELLQEVRQGFGDEISINPVRDQFFSRIEQASGLKDSANQNSLDYYNQKASLLDQKTSEIDSARDAVKSAYESLQEAFKAVEDFNLNLRRTIEDLNIQIKRNKLELERVRVNNRAIIGEYVPGLSAVSKFIKLVQDNRLDESENDLSIEEQTLQINRAQEDRLKEITNLAKSINDAQSEVVKANQELAKLIAEREAIGKELQGVVETKLTTANTHLANIESKIQGALNQTNSHTATTNQSNTSEASNNPSLVSAYQDGKQQITNLSNLINKQENKAQALNKEITLDRKQGGIWTKAGNVIDLGDGGAQQQKYLAPIEAKEQQLRKENKILIEQQKLYQQIGNVAIDNGVDTNALLTKNKEAIDDIIKAVEEKSKIEQGSIEDLQKGSTLRLVDHKLLAESRNLANQVNKKELEALEIKKQTNAEIAKGNRLREEFEARSTRLQMEAELAAIGDRRRELEDRFNQTRSEYGLPGVGYEQTILNAGDKAKSDLTKASKEGEQELINLKFEQVHIQEQINSLQSEIPNLVGAAKEEAAKMLEILQQRQDLLPEETAALERNLDLMQQQTAEIEAAARAKKAREIELFEASTNVDLATQAVDAAAQNPYAFGFGEEAELRKVIEVHRIEVENQQALDSVLEKAIQLGASGGAIDNIKQRFEELKQIKLDSVNQQFDEIGNTLAESLGSNLQSALTGIFNGTKSVGEALRDFALGILNDIASMAAKMLTQNIMSGLFGGNGGQQAGNFVTSIFGGGGGGLLGGGGGLFDSVIGGGDGFGILEGATGLFGGIFRDGGEVGNYATGGAVLPSNTLMLEHALLGMQVSKAMLREGKDAVPIVANTNEYVLSDRTGDAQLYKALAQSGQWNALKQGVNNFSYGGLIGTNRPIVQKTYNYQQTPPQSQQNQINMTIVAKDSDSFRKAQIQIERDTLLALERSKLRSGKR